MLDLPNTPFPTLDRLNASVPPNLDIKRVAQGWFTTFTSAVSAGDVQSIANLLLPEAFWRDMLALTWDFRTFSGTQLIIQFLKDRLQLTKIHNLKLADQFLRLQQPFPNIAWISAMFSFETGVGIGSGVLRLVPTTNGEWKAHVVFTNLESLKHFPERTGALRNKNPNHGKWEERRQKEINFEDGDPKVIIVGGGQCGLAIAARLKYLDISSLVVERNPRIGDNWRNRYEALCLHDPVWNDHMPYLPFPSTWPVYAPAAKLANWLEHYAEVLELNVWTSATITGVTLDASNKWHTKIKRQDGKERQLVANHLIFATGLGSGLPNTPTYPGMEKFKGELLHSSEHKKASDHQGKKVVVIGSCTSAHDIAEDYYNHGIDVTMFQRGSTYVMSIKNGWEVFMKGGYSEIAPPVDIADRLTASVPHHMNIELNQRRVKIVAEMDKDVLAGLSKVGFRTTLGVKDAGFSLLARSRAGGYYIDTGASQLIVDGKIKLKNDSGISEFTERGIKFENGSEISADVVVFATGLGDAREHIRRLCGTEVYNKCKSIWGLNKEGEINGVWRDIGVPGLWYVMGNLALCRFHSTHTALQIKAMEEGIFSTRYSLDE